MHTRTAQRDDRRALVRWPSIRPDAFVEECGEGLRIEGGRGDHQPQRRPLAAHLLEQPEQYVRECGTLVGLVHHHHRVAREQRVAHHLSNEAAVGHVLDARRRVVEPVVEAHRVTNRAPQLDGHLVLPQPVWPTTTTVAYVSTMYSRARRCSKMGSARRCACRDSLLGLKTTSTPSRTGSRSKSAGRSIGRAVPGRQKVGRSDASMRASTQRRNGDV